TPEQSTETAGANWPMYRHDSASTGYSTLAKINTRNVANLSQAWTFSLQSVPAVPTLNSEATPIVVSGVMYMPAANRVVALESETGKEMWSYRLDAGAPSRRGVAYWAGAGDVPPRIFFTSG